MEVPPKKFWVALEQTDQFTHWWPWLKQFDSEGMKEGDRSRVTVKSPLAYEIHFDLEVTESRPPGLLRVGVDGDIRGGAVLELSEASPATNVSGTASTHIRLVFEVEVCRKLLRALSLPAHPVLAWGHDHVMHSGMRRFRRLALGLPDDPI